MSIAYIPVKEVRGQVPGTTCNGARATSAINNFGLCKSREGVARRDIEWNPERNTRSTCVESPIRRGPVSRGPRPSTTPLASVTTNTHSVHRNTGGRDCPNNPWEKALEDTVTGIPANAFTCTIYINSTN